MARRPNYRQERMDRIRKKAARRAEKAAAKADKAMRARLEKAGAEPALDGVRTDGDAES